MSVPLNAPVKKDLFLLELYKKHLKNKNRRVVMSCNIQITQTKLEGKEICRITLLYMISNCVSLLTCFIMVRSSIFLGFLKSVPAILSMEKKQLTLADPVLRIWTRLSPEVAFRLSNSVILQFSYLAWVAGCRAVRSDPIQTSKSPRVHGLHYISCVHTRLLSGAVQ